MNKEKIKEKACEILGTAIAFPVALTLRFWQKIYDLLNKKK